MAPMDKFSQELISAYLDGELTADERARVENLLTNSAAHRKSLAEMTSLAEELHELPGYRLDEEFPERVLRKAGHAQVRLQETSSPATGRQNGGWRPMLASRRGLGVAALVSAAAALLALFLLVRPSESPLADRSSLTSPTGTDGIAVVDQSEGQGPGGSNVGGPGDQ